MTGITPRSIAMARRLIFWYLLTLQNSVMQTVKSANAPWRTIVEKCSLLSLVTISNAEFATRSVNTLDAAEKTPNIVRQPERILCTRAWIICWRHCRTWGQLAINIFDPKERIYHVSNLRILVVNHGILKWFEEIFLELEVR
jgi:hypothetical protein